MGIHLVAVLLTSHQDLTCWYPGSSQGLSKLPGSHRKATGKSERWFCSSKTLASWCFSSFRPPPQEQQQQLHREDTTMGLPHSQTWVLQWLFAMRAIVSQVRYKTWKFFPLIAAADFLRKMLPFLPQSSTSLLYQITANIHVEEPCICWKEIKSFESCNRKKDFLERKIIISATRKQTAALC